MYWGLAILVVLLIAGVCYLLVGQYAEVREYEAAAVEAEQLLAARDKEQGDAGTLGVDVSDDTYQPPPLGETYDTGYWKGNTWHQNPAPKPKKKWWQRDDTRKYLEMLCIGSVTSEFHDPEFLGLGEITGDTDGPGDRRFLRWLTIEHPYSQAGLEAGLVLGGGRKKLLKYHPDSAVLHAEIAHTLDMYASEESVAFAKKSLRLLSTTSEDYSYRGVYGSPETMSHDALGLAYQRLGDYTSALVHLKKAKNLYKTGITGEPFDLCLSSYEYCVKQIEAIEAGKPLWGPDPKPAPQSVLGGISGVSAASDVSDSEGDALPAAGAPRAFPVSRESSAESGFANIPLDSPEAVMRARAVFERQREQDIQSYDKFMREMSQINAARSPEHIEGLVIREMARQWRGDQTEFTSEDFLRVFSSVQRQQSAKLRELERREAGLVREMDRKQRPAPPRRSTPETSNTGGMQ